MQWSFAAWQLAEDVWKQTGNAKEKKISRWGRRARGKDCTNIRKVEQQAEGAKKVCAEIRRGRTAYFCVYYTPYLCNFSNEIFAKHCIILHFLPWSLFSDEIFSPIASYWANFRWNVCITFANYTMFADHPLPPPSLSAPLQSVCICFRFIIFSSCSVSMKK